MSIRDTEWNLTRLIGERVRGLQEYAPEPLEEVAHRLGLPVGGLIKLDANENPYGPTKHTLDILTGYAYAHRYPDPICRRLRQAIGEYLNVDPGCILVGNGSDELIDLTLRLFRPSPAGGGIGQVIDCPPTFGMYSFYGVTNDLEVIEIPRDQDFRVDVEGIVALCQRDPQPKVLFLASPNNPDGQLLSDAELARLLELPLLVVLDEAYIEFGDAAQNSRVGWVAERDNLIVLRTFSKWGGLAGLRVGYGVFPQTLMTALYRLKSPYNVNGLAQAAAQATLEDLPTAQANIHKIVAERERLRTKLQEISFLRIYPSQANFLLCRVQGMAVETIRQAMEKRGIILRYFRPPLEDCIRITVGTPMQDEAVLMVFRALDKERQDGQ
ncbi:MAG: histidinol-phosphate transaminase [Chloroflexi bacterium]|nr:histidinol-phosphate transaminase [Chloroflexota bacterium]